MLDGDRVRGSLRATLAVLPALSWGACIFSQNKTVLVLFIYWAPETSLVSEIFPAKYIQRLETIMKEGFGTPALL